MASPMEVLWWFLQSIWRAFRRDQVAWAAECLITNILEGKMFDDKFKVVEDLIIYKNRVYIVPKSKVKERILRAYHDTPLAGHPGFYKTYKQVREWFSWKGLKK